MKKGDVGMAKRCLKEGMSFNYLQSESYAKICLSLPDATSLHHYLRNHSQYFTILSYIQSLDAKRPAERGFVM